jgi:hypothetical protein
MARYAYLNDADDDTNGMDPRYLADKRNYHPGETVREANDRADREFSRFIHQSPFVRNALSRTLPAKDYGKGF